MFIYSDNEPFTGSAGAIRCNPHKQYLKHFENMMYLQFLQQHPDSTLVERHQATKEIGICERKLKYWSHQSDFQFSVVDKDVQRIKSEWQQKKAA